MASVFDDPPQISCTDRGEIFVHSADETGRWIHAGPQHFYDQSDPAVAALYLDAFDSLRQRGLVKHEGGDLYVLTSRGFKVARALKKQQSAVAEQDEETLPEIPLDKVALSAYIRGSQRVRELDKRVAEEAGVELDRGEDCSLPLLEKAQYFGIKSVAQLDRVVRELGDQPYRLSHYLTPKGKILAGHSLHYVFEILGARLGSVTKFAAYLSFLKYTFTNPTKWAEDIMHVYEQIKMYDKQGTSASSKSRQHPTRGRDG
jgi:uncharacterized protein YjhX (UPF0386 family)